MMRCLVVLLFLLVVCDAAHVHTKKRRLSKAKLQKRQSRTLEEEVLTQSGIEHVTSDTHEGTREEGNVQQIQAEAAQEIERPMYAPAPLWESLVKEYVATLMGRVQTDSSVPRRAANSRQTRDYSRWMGNLCRALASVDGAGQPFPDGWHGLNFGDIMVVGTHDAQSHKAGFYYHQRIINGENDEVLPGTTHRNSVQAKWFPYAAPAHLLGSSASPKAHACEQVPECTQTWGITQSGDLSFQMNHGSRYFDLRTFYKLEDGRADGYPGDWYTHHGCLCLSVLQLLQDTVPFLMSDQANIPGEIIALRLKWEGPMRNLARVLSDAQLLAAGHQLQTYLNAIVAPYWFKRPEDWHPSVAYADLNTIAYQDKRLLIVSDKLPTKVMMYLPGAFVEYKVVKYPSKCCSVVKNVGKQHQKFVKGMRQLTRGGRITDKYQDVSGTLVLYYTTITAGVSELSLSLTLAMTPAVFYKDICGRESLKVYYEEHQEIWRVVELYIGIARNYFNDMHTMDLESQPFPSRFYPTQVYKKSTWRKGDRLRAHPRAIEFIAKYINYVNVFMTDYVELHDLPLVAVLTSFTRVWRRLKNESVHFYNIGRPAINEILQWYEMDEDTRARTVAAHITRLADMLETGQLVDYVCPLRRS